jgi:hypothetical protein
MTIKLTTIGSRISVDVGPSAFSEAHGGVAIRYELFDGPLLVTFTRAEAQQLISGIRKELDAGANGTPHDRLVSFYNVSSTGDESGSCETS